MLAIAAAIVACGTLDAKAQLSARSSDCSSGVVEIDGGTRKPAVVTLGLARGTISIVEFPEADRINYAFEGNRRFAAVFDSPTKGKDRSLAVFPGPDFRFDAGKPGTTAMVTLQMRSGLVVVLEFQAVAEAAQASARCVLDYRVEEVLKARSELGLGSSKAPVSVETEISPIPQVSATQLKEVSDPAEEEKVSSEIARRAVEGCMRSARPCIEAWSKAQNGISIGASRPQEFAGIRRMMVVAVRNHGVAPLKLAPNYPSLTLVTLDSRGMALETSPVAPDRVFAMLPDGDVPAGGFAYFAIAFTAPVTGARQRLIVTAARRDAADEPVSVEIPR